MLDWEWAEDRGLWSAEATAAGSIHAVIVSLPGGVWGWATWHLSYYDPNERRILGEAETAAEALLAVNLAAGRLAAAGAH